MLSKLFLFCSSLNFDSKTSILGCFILILLWKLLARSKNNELLSKMPGPRAYPLVGNVQHAFASRVDAFRQTINFQKTYGEIYATWFGGKAFVWLTNPTFFEEVLHSSNHLGKGLLYKFVEPFLGTGLITSSGMKWLTHRKILTPAFHFKILDSFFGIFSENLKTLTKLLDEKAQDGKTFDLYSYVNHYTLDNICEAAMGVKVDSQKDERSKYASTALRLSELIAKRMDKVWLTSDFIYYNTSKGKECNKLLSWVHAFVDKVIEERKKILQEKKSRSEDVTPGVDELGIKKRLAFLDMLLESAGNENLNLTHKDIRDEVNTFMFAGHDTTTAAILWATYLIGLHPEIQEKLYREQEDIFGDDMERPIMQQDLSKMELLERVMKESIRLFPSVPLIGRTLDKDVKFGNYIVPVNTTVILNIFSLHRDPSLYPEPEKFDPDRFLPENSAQRHSYAYVPFSAGPRNCIGKRFALLEEKLTLASLVRRYEIKSAEKPDDLSLIAEIILRSHTGIKVSLKKRVH